MVASGDSLVARIIDSRTVGPAFGLVNRVGTATQHQGAEH
jgi:hypothetical protein